MITYIEPPESEAEYIRLRKLGLKLGIPIIESFLELEVKMPDGSFAPIKLPDGRIVEGIKQRSHSLTRNAFNYMFMAFAAKDPSDSTFAAGKMSLKDTAGAVKYSTTRNGTTLCAVGASLPTDVDVTGDATNPGYLCSANVDTKGIQVGNDASVESFENYYLIGKISTGNTTGKLAYSAHSLHSVSYAGSPQTVSDALVRFFNNNSGASIDVKEIGLVLSVCDPTGSGFGNGEVMMSRDKLSSTVTVLDTGQLKVTYTISLAYPS